MKYQLFLFLPFTVFLDEAAKLTVNGKAKNMVLPELVVVDADTEFAGLPFWPPNNKVTVHRNAP